MTDKWHKKPLDGRMTRGMRKIWKLNRNNARLSGVIDISKIMKYPILLLIVCLCLPAWGQPVNRKSEIEMCMAQVYSSKEFQQIADSLQLSIDELCDSLVIFPIKK